MIENAEPDAGAIAAGLRAALALLNRRLRGRDDPDGVGATALSLLGRLYREGPAAAGELAVHERLAPQSLTRVVQSLDRRRLITRSVDPADRRRVTLAITETGTGLLRESVRRREAWLAGALRATLSPLERELVRLSIPLIERLAAADA